MKSSPAFQFYPQDFLVGTADLTSEEVGGYIRLLCYQWTKGGLPKDDRKLMQLSGINDPYVLGNVSVKFSLCQDGLLRNERLEKVRQDQNSFHDRQSNNGKLGGNPNFKKGERNPYYVDYKLVVKDNPEDNPEDNPKINSSSSSSSSSVSSKEEYSEGFLRFWNVYPKKVGKGGAWKVWGRIKPDAELACKMCVAVEVHKKTDQWRDAQFIPDPERWLSKRKWEDEIEIKNIKPMRSIESFIV